ncbi:DEAD/DEAH box helicase [Stetteria hydrogenophila]
MPSAMDMLHPAVREAARRLGYTSLLPIQEKAIPHILAGRDVLVVAPTGSGKTEAALLPLLSRMAERGGGGLRLIYITPLRALNRDIILRVERLASEAGFTAALRHGDTPTSLRRRFLENPPNIMVTTPESLNLLLASTASRGIWDNVDYVVVDEVHELLESERGSELAVLLERIEKRRGRRVQRVGLSATLSRRSVEDAARLIAGPRRVEIVEDRAFKKYNIRVEVAVDEWNEEAWRRLVEKVAETALEAKGSVLVFVNTRSVAEKLAVELAGLLGEDQVRVHHGSLSRRVREEAEALFREGKVKVLVATSSMELGIDIGHVDLVIQFLSPRRIVAMVQRAGRSGHSLERVSNAVIVTIGNLFEALESGVIAFRAEKGSLEDIKPHRKPLDALAHQLAAMVLEGSAGSLSEAYELVSRTLPFSSLTMDELEEVARHLDGVRVLRLRDGALGQGRRLRKYLYGVSMIPDEVTYTVEDVVSGAKVGELSGRFVESLALEAGEGSGKGQRHLFTLAGRVWEMLDVDGESGKVLAKPLGVAPAMIPMWEGELIPVDYKVAREVCSIISLAMEDPQAGRRLLEARKLSGPVAERILRVLEGTVKAWGAPYLSPSTPVAEVVDGEAVVFACLGSKGNLALAMLISRLLSKYVGEVVFDYIPYAILLKARASQERLAEAVSKAFDEAARLDKVTRAAMIYDYVKFTKAYVVRFVQVAKRMGVIDPDARLPPDTVRRLVDAYRGSVVDRETIREVVHDKLDLEAVEEFFKFFREIKVVKASKPSPLALEVFGNPYLRRERAVDLKHIALSLLIRDKKRWLAKRRIILACTKCGWVGEREVGEVKSVSDLRCRRCGSISVAVVPDSEWGRRAVEVLLKALRGEKLTKEEKKVYREMLDRAGLVATYASQGYARQVVEALMARGVGPKRARKLMEVYLVRGEEAFYEELMNAEEEYLVNRKYWKT